MKPLNRTVLATPPSGIRKYFDAARHMPDLVSLGVGEPDFVTPWTIREAGINATERGKTGYTSNAGLPELREAIAQHTDRSYGVAYDPAGEILVTVGVSEGLDLTLRALLNPGDEVLYAEPCYVSYGPCIAFAGAVPVALPTHAEHAWVLQPDEVVRAITPRTKAILVCNPSNPTGAAYSRADLEAIVAVAVEHDLYIISDEVYDRLVYEMPHVCIASLPGARERTVLLNGFSKAYAMTGWRLGFACAPAEIAAALLVIHQYVMLCAPHMAQHAAIDALKYASRDVAEMVADYDVRRRFLVGGLNEIGLDCHLPAGAFYAFPSVARTGLTSEEFAERLLQEAHVAVVPGEVFGASGNGFVRCSYATGFAKLEEALNRMRRFVEGLRPA